MRVGAAVRFFLALVVCGPALLLPYRARGWYGQAVAWLVHAPVIVFGRIARLLLDKLAVANPQRDMRES